MKGLLLLCLLLLRITLRADANPANSTIYTPEQTTGAPYFINFGAPTPFLDPQGRLWTTDSDPAGSTVIDDCLSHPFDGLDNPSLYCTYREWPSSSSLLLEIPLTPGHYTVVLHLSETRAQPGERIVDVRMEETWVLEGFDLADRVGGSYGYYTFTFGPGPITDGSASLELRASQGSPTLAGIEIVDAENTQPMAAPTPPPVDMPVSPICASLNFPSETGFSASPSCPGTIIEVAREIPQLSQAVAQIELADLTEVFNCPG